MFRRSFLFGVDSGTANVIGVAKDALYKPGRGYGFVTELNRKSQELLQLPELNSGFETMYWYQDKVFTKIQSDVNGCFVDSGAIMEQLADEEGSRYEGEERRIPLCFKMDVPRQGNYSVTLEIMSADDMRDVLIFTGRRRLAFKGDIKGGERFSVTMLVNVCDIVPRGKERIYTDKTLDITVVADMPRITAMQVQEIKCPTIYIAGDSTVTDQSAEYPYAPGTSYSGWGQMLTAFMNTSIAVSNHSHSGLTTESFRKEGHYAIIDQYSAHRDYYFLQFGHNDQKLDELKARGGYRVNMLRYISECRSRGAYPIIVTPLARNSWKGDGTYNDLLEEYAQACIEIGEVTETPVLDLHKLSMDFIVENGLEKSKSYLFPNDFTHSNDYGAYKMASFIAQELRRVCGNHTSPSYRFLAKCVTEGFGEWTPAEVILLPKKPAIYEEVSNPNEAAQLLSEIEDLDQNTNRASALDMIIKTARFFPTNVYNDMYTDVVGHEWYAGCVEAAYQNGIIAPEMVVDGCFFPEKEVSLEEFLVFAMNGYASRKKLPEEVPCVYDANCTEYAKRYVRLAYVLGLIAKDGTDDLSQILTRGEAVRICRSMNI